MPDPIPLPSQRAATPRADAILTAIAMALATLAVLFVLAFVSQNQTQGAVLRRIDAIRPARLQSARLSQALVDVETGERGYLLTGDRAFLEPYESGRRRLNSEIDGLRATAPRAPEIAGQIRQAESSALAALAAIDHTLQLHRTHPLTRQQMARELQASKDSMDAARAAVQELAADVERTIEVGRVQNASSRSAIYVLGALLGVLAIVAVVVAAWALRQERRAWRATFSALSEAREAAELARAKAAASDLAKTRFLATASHDMRQPLHALTLYLSALDRRVQSQEARDILKKMERAAESMVGMFATLLDLARIQADIVEPEVVVFPIRDVIERLIAEHPGANVTAAYGSAALSVRTDPMLLERLLRNLISNGLKHGGGSVRVVVTPLADEVRISVVDRGPGIAAEDQARVFEEFVRLEGKGGSEGLGLGLAIVKRIAELLGLRITLESAPRNGATFSVFVPLSAPAPLTAASRPGAATRLNGESILLMDDDPNALEALAAVVRDLGANVVGCGDEAAAREIIQEGFRPDLLIMDLRIDGALRGLEITDRLRAMLNPPPPAIIVTGDTAADTLTFLSDSGHQWLIKPVEPAAMMQAIASQLRGVAATT